jgi:hypothetical protein
MLLSQMAICIISQTSFFVHHSDNKMKVFFKNTHSIHEATCEGQVLKTYMRNYTLFVHSTVLVPYYEDCEQHDMISITHYVVNAATPDNDVNCLAFAASGVFATVMTVDSAVLMKRNVLSPTPSINKCTNISIGCCNQCLIVMPIGHICIACNKAHCKTDLGCSLFTKIVTQSKHKFLSKEPKQPKSFVLNIGTGDNVVKIECTVVYFNPGVVSLLFHALDKCLIFSYRVRQETRHAAW